MHGVCMCVCVCVTKRSVYLWNPEGGGSQSSCGSRWLNDPDCNGVCVCACVCVCVCVCVCSVCVLDRVFLCCVETGGFGGETRHESVILCAQSASAHLRVGCD